MHDWMRSLDKTFFTINLVSMNSPKSDAFEKASFLQQIPSKPFNFMSHQMNEDKNDERSVVDSVLVQEDSSTMRPPLHESSSMENTLAKSKLQDIENPTIERLRDGLRIRLQQSNQQAKQALLDQEKSLRALQKEREDVGVELYELQKQLSIMQSDRNELHEKRKDVTENRKQNDVSIHEIRKKLSDSQEALRTCKKRRVDLEAEVDEILKSHRLANTWNQDLKHDVAVSRRSALKTEDIVRDMEKNKKSQDLFLDQLNQQINALDSTITLLVEEKEAQCQQTNETKELILTTKHELDKLITEKKQFVQQWKAAIVSRNRREKALSECMRAFQEKQDTLTEAIREIALLRVDLISVNDEAHALVLDKNRQETEASYVQEETEKLRGNVETVATEFEIVRKSIAMSQERQLEVELQKNKMDAELASTRRKMQLVIKEKQKLEISIQRQKNDQSLLTKEALAFIEETRAVAEKIREKEMDSINIQNSISRAKVERMDTKGHIEQLKGDLEKEMKRCEDKEGLIVRMEGIIRKTQDEIVTKMKRNDLLNQSYAKMISQAEDPEPTGPLEATVKSLKINNSNESVDIDSLQKQWFTTQEAIMMITNELDTEQSKMNDHLLRLDVLKQQSLRLAQISHRLESEQKSFDHAIKGMQFDMSKLNGFIDKNEKNRIDVANDIIIVNQDKELVLKEVQDEILRIEKELNERTLAKREKLNDILEQERQILHWEKMTQLEKDTRAALTTSDHAMQIKGMEKEINRMNMQLNKLKRKEDVIVREIELEMQKKEDLSSRFHRDAYDVQSSHSQLVTMAVLEKKSEHLKSQIQNATEECLQADRELIEAEQTTVELSSIMAQLNIDCIKINDQISGIRSDLDTLQTEKSRLTLSWRPFV